MSWLDMVAPDAPAPNNAPSIAAPWAQMATPELASPKAAPPGEATGVLAPTNNPGLLNTDEVARWLTFGLSDKAAALGSATGAALGLGRPNESATAAYSRRLQELRGQSSAYAQEHPIGAAVGPIFGSLIAAPPSAAASAVPSLGQAIRQSAVAGGTIGALQGAGQSDDPLRGAALGGIGGAAFGSLVPPAIEAARPVLEGAQRLVPGLFPDAAVRQATSRIGNLISQDASAGGPDIAGITGSLAQAAAKPQGIVDVGGENLRAFAGQLARAPGPSREIARNFFNTRDADAGARLVGDIDQAFAAKGGNAYDTMQGLMQQRAQAAAPLYERALSPGGTIHSERLQQFLDDPITRQGLAQGLEVQRLESLAAGRPFNPNDYTVVYPNPAATPQNVPELMGVPSFAPTPNMRTLDAAKRGLDNILDQYRDPTTGRLVLDQRGRAIDQVRQAYVKELDNLNPDYAAARQAWSGPSQSMDAMRMGQNFDQMRPEQIRDQIARMGGSDRDFFLAGVADKLRSNVQRTAINGDEAKRLVNNQYVQNQLKPLFSNQDDYQRFIDSVGAERRMFETRTPVMGGSQTAARVAEDAHGAGSNPWLNVATGAFATAAHEPFVGWPMILRGLKGAYATLGQPSAATRETAARMLFNPDYTQNMALLQSLQGRRPAVPLRPMLVAPGAATFGALAPGMLEAGRPSAP